MNLSDDLISFEYPLGLLFLGNSENELTQKQNLWTPAYRITGLFSGLALFINSLSFKSIPYFELVGNSISSGKLSIKLDL